MKTALLSFATSALATAIALSAARADANLPTARSFSAYACNQVGFSYGVGHEEGTPITQVGNPLPASVGSLFCPVTSDTAISASAPTAQLRLHGWANDAYGGHACGNTTDVDGFSAVACRSYAWGGGGSCGNEYRSSGPGLVDNSLDVSAWTNAWATQQDGYFVIVKLGCYLHVNPNDWRYNTFWSYTLEN
jgi:hypothetical protein